MSQFDLPESAVIASWQDRLRTLKLLRRKAGRIALGVLLVAGLSFGASRLLAGEAQILCIALTLLLVIVGLPSLGLWWMTLYRVLRCPRCGMQLWENDLTCRFCVAPLSIVSPFSEWSKKRAIEISAGKSSISPLLDQPRNVRSPFP
jgi:hypothetical protein